jgi:hypothetical protein
MVDGLPWTMPRTGRPLNGWTVACAALFAGAFGVVWRYFTFTGFNNDHYVHVSRAQQMLLGELPVRDFTDPGMPLMYAASAAARVVAGPALGTEWALVAIAIGLAAAGTVVAGATLARSAGVALAVALLEVLANPRSFSYPKLVLYAWAAVAIVATVGGPSRARGGVLAVTIAVAFLFRHDHGLYIGVASAVALAVALWPQGPRVALLGVAELTAAVALLLAPWALFVAANGGLIEYFRSGLDFSRIEAGSTMLSAWPALDWSEGGSARDNGIVVLFYQFHLLPLVCLALAASRARRGLERWRGETAAVTAVAVMAIPVNIGFLRDSLPGRWPDAVVPAALLGAWLIGLSWQPRRALWRLGGVAAAVVGVGLVTTALCYAAETREQLGRSGVLSGWGSVQARAADLWERLQKRLPERDQVPSRYAGALFPFMAFLDRCTTTNDRLWMTGLFPEVYVLSQRGFAGGQQAYLPGYYSTDAEQRQTIDRFDHQSVPFAVQVLSIETQFRDRMGLLAQYLDTNYEPIARIEVSETPGVELYVRRGRTPGHMDRETGWPCFR